MNFSMMRLPHKFGMIASALAVLVARLACSRRHGLGVVVDAAHSRRRVVVRPASSGRQRYDRSITTFDPTGRLLQVEYGLQAAQRGSTFLVALVVDDEYALIVTESTSSTTTAGTTGDTSATSKVHRITPSVFMVTAGLSGDARALASLVRSYCLRHQLTYGEMPTVKQVARHVADLQHVLTRTGGARPLGCTATIVGVDPIEGGARSSMKLYQTDPGGVLEECICSVAGQSQASVLAELRKRCSDIWVDGNDSEDDVVDNTDDDSSGTTCLIRSASTILQSFAAGADVKANDENRTLDVWVLRPSHSRRGGVHVTCFKDVERSHPQPFLEALATHVAEDRRTGHEL